MVWSKLAGVVVVHQCMLWAGAHALFLQHTDVVKCSKSRSAPATSRTAMLALSGDPALHDRCSARQPRLQAQQSISFVKLTAVAESGRTQSHVYVMLCTLSHHCPM